MTDDTMLQLTPVHMGGELRIKDEDLGVRLGFAKARDIRPLIERHRAALCQIGPLPVVEETVGKGQKAQVAYLNRKQAIFITAKSETDTAVDTTIEIIERFDAYEHGAAPRPAVTGLGAAPRHVTSTFGAYFKIARLIGLDQNQSALSAGRATKAAVGEDPLEAMGVTHLLAPQQEPVLTPSDIGARLGGMSGMAVNSLLQERGLQTGRRDANDRPHWEPTEAGKPYAVFLDTSKRHSDGTPVRQLKWTASIVGALSADPGQREGVSPIGATPA